MASITPLRGPAGEPAGPLARVRDLVRERLATTDGHTATHDPDLCFHRFSEPTTIRKAATFGVTLGVVLQGNKRVRIDRHEFAVDPLHLLVVTRETEHLSLVLAGSGQPYLGMSMCFAPDRVARALLALTDAGGPTVTETVPAFVMPCDAPISDALERLVRTLADPLDRKLLAPLIIDELLFRLLRSNSAAAVRSGVARTPDALRILESMKYIQDHHARKLTVEALAKRAGMSASHYAHRFSSVARISPMRFLREARLERALATLRARVACRRGRGARRLREPSALRARIQTALWRVTVVLPAQAPCPARAWTRMTRPRMVPRRTRGSTSSDASHRWYPMMISNGRAPSSAR